MGDKSKIESIVSQCRAAGVPCFIKQLGSYVVHGRVQDARIRLRDRKGGDPKEWPSDLRVREFPDGR